MKNNTTNTTVRVNNEDHKKQNIQNQLTEHVNNMENHKNYNYYMRSKNILSPETIEKEFRNTMMHGLPAGINSGISNLDELFRLDRGKLVVITGIPNMGKSEFVDALCVQYNMLHRMRTLFFSPENQPIGLHINKLFAKFVGRKYSQDDLLGEIGINVRRYIYENFSFFNYLEEYSLPDILSTAEVEILGKGIDIVVLDSYNKILHDYGKSETEEIGRDLDHLERFAKRLNVIIILVAHPRKMEKDRETGNFIIPSAYDINGSANFYNRADYVGTVHRVYDPNYTIVKISKVKFSNYGGQGKVHLGYDLRNGRFYDIPDMDLTRVLPHPPEAKPFDLDTHRKSGKEWLNVFCSVSKRVTSKETSTVLLWDFLTCERPALIESLDKVRAESDHKVASKAKVDLLPVVMPSVVIEGERKRENIRGFTNLICIDIDKKDNEMPMEEIFKILKSLPYVAFAQRSCSGEGYYAIIPIKYERNHLEHFLALEEDFAQMGITIDKACKDETRTRFFSYDPDRYVAEKCEAYVRRVPCTRSAEVAVVTATEPPRFSTPTHSSSPEDLMAKLDKACEGIEAYDVCPTYQAWFEVGSALGKELGENGRRYFHQLSRGYKGYDAEETDQKYSEIMKEADRYSFTAGTIFYHINNLKRM